MLADDDRDAVVDVDAPEQIHDAAGELRIQARRGLVGQDHRRRLREGARDRHPLLLAARQRVGTPLGEVREANLGEAVDGAAPILGGKVAGEAPQRRDVAEAAREHVLQHRHAPHEIELLKDHADATPNLAKGGRRRAGDLAPVDAHDTARRFDEAVDRAEQRGLAGAALAEDDDELAGSHDEIHAVEDHGGGRQRDAQPRDLDHADVSAAASRGCRRPGAPGRTPCRPRPRSRRCRTSSSAPRRTPGRAS